MCKFQTQLWDCYHVHSSNVVLEWMLVDPVGDNLTLVQVKAWGSQKKKSLPDPVFTKIFFTIWCHYATMSQIATSEWLNS